MWVKELFGPVFQRLKAVPEEVKYVVSLFVATRVVLAVIGMVARNMVSVTEHAFKFSGISWLDVWGVWDSKWYMRIAADGYSTKIYEYNYANYGFFPLYPLLMRFVGGFVGNDYIAGLLISNISLIVACFFLYKLVRLDDDKSTALRSIKYLFFFPSAFILSGVFSEGLFLALLIACFYYARKEKWLVVGILGFFLSVTRYIGFVAMLPLLFEYFKARNFKLRQARPNVLFLLLFPAGFMSYMAFLYRLTGDPLAYFHIQKTGWGFGPTNPLPILFSMPSNSADAIAKAAILVALFLVIISFKRIRFSYWFLAMYSILIPLFSAAIHGTLRFYLPIFPFFIILSKFSENNNLDVFATAVTLLLQGFLMVFWTVGAYMII